MGWKHIKKYYSYLYIVDHNSLYSGDMSTCKQLLEELRRDEELRKALAEELLPEALRHRNLRKVMLLALSREMATKEDIENLRKATKEDIEKHMEKLKAELKSYIDEKVNSINMRVATCTVLLKHP